MPYLDGPAKTQSAGDGVAVMTLSLHAVLKEGVKVEMLHQCDGPSRQKMRLTRFETHCSQPEIVQLNVCVDSRFLSGYPAESCTRDHSASETAVSRFLLMSTILTHIFTPSPLCIIPLLGRTFKDIVIVNRSP